jgi:hypothetical protein
MSGCANCTHWTTGSWIPEGYGQCDVLTYGDQAMAYVEHHGMCDTWLYTHPDFACILYEPKDA